MKEIYLKKCYSKLLVDDEDYERVLSHTKNWVVSRSSIYGWSSILKKNVFIAKIILNLPEDSDFVVDHIDRNFCNNQKSNLRLCSYLENSRNRNKHRNSSSKYKGVSFYKRDNKWSASIRVNGVLIYLGKFISEEDAAKAYDKSAKEHFKEFAALNFK